MTMAMTTAMTMVAPRTTKIITRHPLVTVTTEEIVTKDIENYEIVGIYY